MDIKDFAQFIIKANYDFKSIDDAIYAYEKHANRNKEKIENDIILFWRNRYSVFIYKKYKGIKPQSIYNFGEIKHILKRYRLWGRQVFNDIVFSNGPIREIYNKNGIKIRVNYYYGFYEILGLRPDDYARLKKE